MKESYKILGIDPGTNVLGYSVLEIYKKTPQVITLGIIHLKNLADHQSKLREIFLQIQEIIECYLPECMAIEAPFYGRNVQSMLKLGRAQGVAMAAGMTMGIAISEYAPKKVKMSITGNGNASKEQVAGMLEQILSYSMKEQHLDATDALAVAVCHFHQNLQLANKSQYKDWGAFIKANPGKIK